DHNALFADIATLQSAVEKKLVQTPQEIELTALTQDYFLLKKLSSHILVQEEWARYQERHDAIAKIGDRVASLGTSALTSWGRIAAKWDVSADFYRAAAQRDGLMANPFASRFGSDSSKYGLVVAGGFHAEGVAKKLADAGFSVLTLSPKITDLD